MKTIFVTLPIGLSVRNILFTGVLDKIVFRGDVRVVALTAIPNLSERYPNAGENLIFELLPQRRRRTLAGLVNYSLNLRFNQIYDDPALTSVRAKRQWLKLIYPKQYMLETLLSQPFPRSKTVFGWLSAFHDHRAASSKDVGEIFDRYQPSLMFATHPTAMNEFDFLKHAKDRGISTMGMIHSWDVLTTEGRMVVPLDHYFLWNHVMRQELMDIHGVAEDKISITGIPQFDVYADQLSPDSRQEFLRQQGLDPAKPTVLFATSAGGLTPEEPDILASLVTTLNRDLAGNVQFLVRIHQQDDVGRYAFITDENVKFQVPGFQMRNLDDWRLMDDADLRMLRDTLAFSDVVVNTASTITIDAIALGKPVVNIAFDLQERDYYRSVRQYFDRIHFQLVVKSGASKVAGSLNELTSHVQRYLADPELEQEERARFAEDMCHRIDGNSAERIAAFLLNTLDNIVEQGVGTTVRR